MTGLLWLSWRQQRLVLTAGLATIAAAGLTAILEREQIWNLGGSSTRVLAAYLPVALGLFWGAPLLARPLENGTAELFWTQSVSRARWLAGALVPVFAATLVVSLTMRTIAAAMLGGQYAIVYRYDVEYAGAVGYALFAVALGVFLGAVLGRVEWAMGATLLGYAAVRVVVGELRFDLVAPVRATLDFRTADAMADDVIRLSDDYRQHDVVLTFQNADHLARLQWIEFGLYAGLAAVLIAATFAVVVRRGVRA